MARFGLQLSPLVFPLLLGSGCMSGEYAFPTSDDFRIAKSEGESARDASLQEYGDVYALGMQSAHEVNGWIGEGVDAAGRVIGYLERLPPTSVDGDWEVYGPYTDPDTGLDWRFRMQGDAEGTQFEVAVGSHGGKLRNLLTGGVDIDGDMRMGNFSMDFDTVEMYELKAGPDKDRSYQGKMDIRFERDTSSEHKIVEIEYDNFEVTQAYPIKEYFAADGYDFRRNKEGAGSFHLDIISTFQAQVWSGPERERMTIDLEWDESGAGYGEGRVLELEDEGDLAHGDIALDECFDESGYVIWRELGGEYGLAFPEYNTGEPADCPNLDDDAELPTFRN
jgi:hypothetical protein